MTTEADRKELAYRIEKYSGSNRGQIGLRLEEAGIEYRTWRRAAIGIGISDVEFQKISAFLSDNSLIRSKEETGIYLKDDFVDYYGFYDLYRPNSADENRIEVFRAQFEWDKNLNVAKVVAQIDNGSLREFIVYKPAGNFLFLRGAVRGWSSLYALDNLWDCRIQDGQAVSVMTGVSVAMDYTDRNERSIHPVLFPIVLEKVRDKGFMPYRQEVKPNASYERLHELLAIAARLHISSTDVWSRFMMPGDANGGPRKPY
ncbi:hypothetical protein [Mesorhizobium sp. M0239]|uniref:hypothetical protein n=1 Tax=Mesorhizobium sp. M0239 TaxID=2956924 RepID=UPI003337B9C5